MVTILNKNFISFRTWFHVKIKHAMYKSIHVYSLYTRHNTQDRAERMAFDVLPCRNYVCCIKILQEFHDGQKSPSTVYDSDSVMA